MKFTSIFTLLCLFAVSFSLYGQNAKPVEFKSGSFIPKNITEFDATHDFEVDELVYDYYYRIIQFNEIPNTELQKNLKDNGIELLMYLPANTYYAAIEKTAKLDELNGKISAFFKLETKNKLSNSLAKETYNNWAIVEDELLINAVYYKHLSAEFIASQFAENSLFHFIKDKTGNRVEFKVPFEQLDEFYNLPFFYYFEEIDAPSEPENLVGVTNHRSNTIATSYDTGLDFDGSGVTMMLQDNSLIDEHIDYTGRFFDQASASQSGDHGEHCAGIMGGAGNLDPTTRGMAYGADVLVFGSNNDNYDDVPSLYATNDLTITSKSYGNGTNAGYTTLASELDQQIHSMPSLVHVFSCGNSNGSGSTGAGSQWYNITGGHKSGKNVIAVGNLDEADVIANSSSRGPSEDGRIKPDICAVGSSVYSTTDPNTYTVKSGTSMACPGVAGTLAQLYQAYKELNGGMNPNSGLMKATIMNTADDLGNVGPDYIYGWGRINARRAYDLISQNNYLQGNATQASSNNHVINVPAGVQQVKVMLYWTDIEGSPSASVALVNDLDLQITDPTTGTHNPWVLANSFSAPALAAPATTGADHINNMEQVVIDNPVAGNYTINVSGFAIPFGAQEYFVVYEYITTDVVLTYPIGGEGINHAVNEVVRWDAAGNAGTFTLEYSTNNGTSWNLISNSIAAGARSYDWNVPNVVSGEALVRVTRGASSSESHVPFSIIGVPTGLSTNYACPDSMEVSWNAVSGATGYEVSLLGTKYMDSVGVSTGTSLVIAAPANVDHWWSVKALGPNNCEGRRALAVFQASGVFNCVVNVDAALADNSSFSGVSINECNSQGDLIVEVILTNSGTTAITNIPLSYQLNGGTVVNELYAATINPGGTASYAFTSILNPANGVNNLSTWVAYSGDGNSFNDTSYSTFNYSSAPPVSLPWSEDFESFSACGTANDCEIEVCQLANNFINESNGVVDDIDWRTNSGDTPSNTTGPSIDYLPGNAIGNYLYLEASNSCNGQSAYLTSPCIDLTNETSCFLEFAYHMLGDDMGTLHLDILVNGSWDLDIIPSFTGNLGSNWLTENVDLSAYLGNIVVFRWRGITGNGYSSDMAIDAINVYSTAGNDELSFENSFKIYPNPSEGLFNFTYLNAEPAQIKISDASGSTLLVQELMSGSQNGQVDLSAYANGIYFLSVISEESTLVKKIIKK